MKGRLTMPCFVIRETACSEMPLLCSAAFHVETLRRTRQWVVFFLVFPALLFLLAACGGMQEVRRVPPVGVGTPGGVEKMLRIEADRWIGTPHRLGGNDRTGIDCSALVAAVYRDVFGAQLPRTTAEQIQIGEALDGPASAPGDLVFFLLPFRSRHVGLYLGAGEFLHASKSNGVEIARIDADYWRRYFTQARRILHFDSGVAP